MREELSANSISLMKLDFITKPLTEPYTSEDIELLYVLRGAVDIEVEENRYALTKGDILVVNVEKKHSFAGKDETFMARLRISYALVGQLLKQSMLYFSCNSTQDKNEAYEEMRAVIHRILSNYLQKDTGNQIYLYSLYYRLLHILCGNFLLTGKDIRQSGGKSQVYERTEEILHYIRSNYYHSITLQDLADKLYLSTSYLSKFIKKEMDKNFLELVTQVRLNHALDDLSNTDLSVLNVAMQNGFASLTAFNKSFKDAYGQTPSEYRKETEKQKKISAAQPVSGDPVIAETVLSYFKNEAAVTEKPDHSNLLVELSASDSRREVWRKNGNQMINIGTALNLSSSIFRSHVLQLKNELGFQYVRFWDLYGKDMLIDIHAPKNQLNFGRLDDALDFLIQNGLKPYVELGFKPLRLLKTTHNAVREVAAETVFQSHEEMESFYFEMTAHLIRRYGADEVETWYFELWKREKIRFVDLSFTYTPLSERQNLAYFDEFDAVSSGIRRALPNAKIGGGGFAVQHYGQSTIDLLLKTWRSRTYQPDFISLNCFPYVLEKEGNIYFEKKSTDMFFVQHTAESVRRAMDALGFSDTELHVSEYNLSLSNRNAVHDSCQKGAFLLQTLISGVGRADLLGYWVGSDMYADYQDTQDFLFGGCGLLTKTGIPKPAFYAFRFFRSLYPYLVSRHKNAVVTENAHGAWRIACHNFKNFNYSYYLSDEHEIQPAEIPFLSEDQKSLELSIQIKDLENGCYVIKRHAVNSDHGSIQNELERLQAACDIGREEQAYLGRICTPQLSAQACEVEENILECRIILAANEIQLIHIEKSDG